MGDTDVSVVLVPATPGAPSTAPPQSPWWLAAKRFGQLVAPLVPILLTVLLDLYSRGELHIPPAYAGLASVLVAMIQAIMKGWKEQQRQEASADLEARGLPMNRTLPADHLMEVLYSDATLPKPPQVPA